MKPSNQHASSGPSGALATEASQFSARSITLPKGGGAIRGISEKFATNPVTGTGSMSVPIATSPGRSGFGPQLSLSYDSGAGNGPFGFGWSLSLPSITRKTDKGLPQYFDTVDSDVFILSGAEDLVPVYRQDPDGTWIAGQPGFQSGRLLIHEDEIDDTRVRRYGPRIEGLFAHIERWSKIGSPSDVHWRSISKDNILTLYGFDADSRIADPLDAGRIFTWLICETRDDKGNGVLYRYMAEDGHGVDLGEVHERNRGPQNDTRRTANRYLKRIYYDNRTPLLDNAGHRPRFLDKAQIDINYERNPTDPRISHSFGLQLDEYGNAREACSVVYGRKAADTSLPAEVTRDQQHQYITHAETDYTPDIEQGVPGRGLSVVRSLRVKELRDHRNRAGCHFVPVRRDQGQDRRHRPDRLRAPSGRCNAAKAPALSKPLFLNNALNPLPLGQRDSLALGHKSYQLTFTPAVTAAHCSGKVSDAEFAAAGYVHFNGDTNWWMPSGTAIYHANPRATFYLPIGAKDPLGVETMATFDQHVLLIERVEVKHLPLGMKTCSTSRPTIADRPTSSQTNFCTTARWY